MTEWLDTIPNTGLICYRGTWNREILLPTTAQALADVMVSNASAFHKSWISRARLGGVTGINSMLFMEGNVHKVCCDMHNSYRGKLIMIIQIERKNLNPAFTLRRIRRLHPIWWRISGELVNALILATRQAPGCPGHLSSPTAATLHMRDWLSRANLDAIGLAMYV